MAREQASSETTSEEKQTIIYIVVIVTLSVSTALSLGLLILKPIKNEIKAKINRQLADDFKKYNNILKADVDRLEREKDFCTCGRKANKVFSTPSPFITDGNLKDHHYISFPRQTYNPVHSAAQTSDQAGIELTTFDQQPSGASQSIAELRAALDACFAVGDDDDSDDETLSRVGANEDLRRASGTVVSARAQSRHTLAAAGPSSSAVIKRTLA